MSFFPPQDSTSAAYNLDLEGLFAPYFTVVSASSNNMPLVAPVPANGYVGVTRVPYLYLGNTTVITFVVALSTDVFSSGTVSASARLRYSSSVSGGFN